MVDGKRIKNYVIFALIFVIIVMTVAIVVLAYNNPTFLSGGSNGGNGNGDASWKVEFTDIKVVGISGNAQNASMPHYESTHAYFDVNFELPNDSITYEITISNLGLLDAKLSSIDRIEGNIDFINYYVEGLKEGDVLKAGETKTIIIRVAYELDTNISAVNKVSEPISLSFYFEQA